MKIYYLGTCSGTEPMAGMHHTSLVIECGGHLYWFDAGENCSHTAYTAGLPVMMSRAVFVSHPHIDHVGGLANLLALFEKLERRYGMKLVCDNRLDVVFPDLELFGAVKAITFGKCSGYNPKVNIAEHTTCDGVIYEDENIRVTATHNRHLNEDGTKGYHSYSFLVEAEGKRVVVSGDVKTSSELDGLLADGCDLLIHETGHHAVCDVLEYAREKGVKALRFIHHGRDIIENRADKEREVASFSEKCGISMRICSDGDFEEI